MDFGDFRRVARTHPWKTLRPLTSRCHHSDAGDQPRLMVGAAGFEPATSGSQSTCATVAPHPDAAIIPAASGHPSQQHPFRSVRPIGSKTGMLVLGTRREAAMSSDARVEIDQARLPLFRALLAVQVAAATCSAWPAAAHGVFAS